MLKGEAIKMPNTWADRPAHRLKDVCHYKYYPMSLSTRYPYYDHTGLGYGPLYGFGGPDLWEYKIWDDIEGFH